MNTNATIAANQGIASLVTTKSQLSLTRATRISDVDPNKWDQLVPLNMPHLRYGFLKATEESGQVSDPNYICAWRDGRLVGVLHTYDMNMDLLTLMPRKYTRWIDAIRGRLAPRLLYIPATICGPIVTNCNNNICVASDISTVEQHEIVKAMLRSMEAVSKSNLFAMFEFSEEAAAICEPAMIDLSYVKASSLPGTRMDVKWNSLDEYIESMRKAFRRTVVKDRKAATNIEFDVVNDFSEIAEEAWQLYNNVLSKAEFIFESLTPEFFKELAKYDRSRLVTARDRSTGKLVGIELLLCGDTVLQDLYTGIDYTFDPDQRLYFNLIYPVIGMAGEKGFQTLSMGQTAYTFKARLGVKPYPLRIYIKHKNSFVHHLISILKGILFPEKDTVTYKVFRGLYGAPYFHNMMRFVHVAHRIRLR